MSKSSGKPGPDEDRLELLERSELLDYLAAGLAEAADGRGRMVLLGGEAGAGKTVLLREFCAGGLPDRVLWGACERLFTPRALGPFLDIAQKAGVDLGGFVHNRRVPHEFAGALVAELANEFPTVLVVEDVHWADEGTLDVIKLLGRRIDTLPVLALISFRDDQLTADGALQIVLGELAGTRAAERRHVPSLSFEAVRTLAEPAGVDAARLFERTGGNPFFVSEALAAGGEVFPRPCATVLARGAARFDEDARTAGSMRSRSSPRARAVAARGPPEGERPRLDACLAPGCLCARRPVGVPSRDRPTVIEEALSPHRRVQLSAARARRR